MRFGFPQITIDSLQGSVRQWAVAEAGETPDAGDFGVVDTAETSLLPGLEFGTINLAAIDFAYTDEAGAIDTRFKIDKLLARLNPVDLKHEWVDIREMDLDGSDSPVFFDTPESPADHVASAPVTWRGREDTGAHN